MYAFATVDRLKQAGSILFAFILLAAVLGDPAFSQESFGFTERAVLYDNWCTVRNPVVIGDYTYVPSSTHLRVMDTSDPTRMQDIFETPDELRFPCDFLVRVNDYLWCFNGTRDDGKIRAVNVENPASPFLEMTHEIELRGIFQVEQQGTLVFLTTAFGYMEVMDLSSPLSPVVLDEFYAEGHTRSIDLYADYIYIAREPDGTDSNQVDIFYFDNEEYDLDYINTIADTIGNRITIRNAISNDYLIVQIDGSITLFDLSVSPGDPEMLGTVEVANIGVLEDAVVLGDKLYLASRRLFVVDIADPANPVLEYDYEQFIPMWLMPDSSGQNMALNSYYSNLIVHVSSLNEGEPEVLYNHVVPPSAVDIEIDYPFACVLFSDSLVIYDMSDLDQVTHVTTLTPDSDLTALDIQEDYLLLSDYSMNTRVYYIHDPYHPQLMMQVQGAGRYDVKGYIRNNILYIQQNDNQLTIFDLEAYMVFGEVIELGRDVNSAYYGRNVFHIVENDGLYLIMSNKDGIGKWTTVDVTNPTEPVFVCEEEFHYYLSHPETAYFVGDTLNIISLDRHWGRMDFSNPLAPDLIDNIGFWDDPLYASWPLYALYQEPFWLISIYDNEPLMVVRRNGEDAILPLECVEQFGRSRKFDICNDALGYVDYVAVHLYSAKEAVKVQEEVAVELPDSPVLAEPYPNPFNPSVTIPFTLPEAGEVEIAVFNLLGQQVTTLAHTHFTVGRHSVMWDASADGFEAPSGVYFVRMKAGGQVQTRKIMLLK